MNMRFSTSVLKAHVTLQCDAHCYPCYHDTLFQYFENINCIMGFIDLRSCSIDESTQHDTMIGNNVW